MVTFAWAEKIAGDRTSTGHEGFIVASEIDDEFARRYPTQIAGRRKQQELWVAADEADAFNCAIVGTIEVGATYLDGARVAAD